ncbi:MBL fold metallo-hydrolase [Lonsdalea iberica]|uniref:MBL fold metallo-hydrolase n=1 Tax=Lonsdalea iberica TaxID=1082703 RepID=A0A1X3RQX2_9GAMM|nr:MBL fold metallo-hydrolase [Lonsdalea iberica]OSN04039.1 MBL fold metallo-hydrolase [Lonsdalea iberica]
MLLTSLVIIVVFIVLPAIYLHRPEFVKISVPEVKASDSDHYQQGQFHNVEATPVLTGGGNIAKLMLDFALHGNPRRRPRQALPTAHTSLLALPADRDVVIWLGHSSFYVQLAGKRLLVDPVLNQNAAPVPFGNRAFRGTNPFSPADMPNIDYLLMTHDHWDHLDYATLIALRPKVKQVICGLGVGQYFRAWGFDSRHVHEADWFSELNLGDGINISVLPARHFSGRLFKKNHTLWVSFALETATRRLYFSGDSGYGAHFKKIGELHGGFDFVALDSGQYDERWSHVHMRPEEAAQAATDLRARALLPGHIGKFALAQHDWNDPFIRIEKASKRHDWRLLTPLIGQPLWLDDSETTVERWWEKVPR